MTIFAEISNFFLKKIVSYHFQNLANFSTAKNKFRYFCPIFLAFSLWGQMFRAKIDEANGNEKY